LIQGGDSGLAIQLGNSTQSLLVTRITATDDSRMPPNGSPLDPAQIDALSKFIDQGAPWGNQTLGDPRLQHWAWQPIQSTQLPEATEMHKEEGNPIDRFLDASLAEKGLMPLATASREALIRRLSYDLLGVPPSPEEVDQFAEDHSPDAWEKLVDRMLASPRYGERWARHWLDIAHYADTHGFERDQRRDHAWRYRDWVIDAWNNDLPFDTFVQHQIAGDVLPGKTPETTVASSFLAAGPWDFVGQVETPSPLIKRLARADDLDDMVAQVMTSFCGITIHCARCHHHKLDPVNQEEYYALTAIFSGVKRGDRIVSDDEKRAIEIKRSQWKELQQKLDQEIQRATGGLSLADIVGGGNGLGAGTQGSGIDPSTGERREEQDRRGFLNGVVANRLNATQSDWIDSVFIPDGGPPRTKRYGTRYEMAQSTLSFRPPLMGLTARHQDGACFHCTPMPASPFDCDEISCSKRSPKNHRWEANRTPTPRRTLWPLLQIPRSDSFSRRWWATLERPPGAVPMSSSCWITKSSTSTLAWDVTMGSSRSWCRSHQPTVP
jgi:hypothetical protein